MEKDNWSLIDRVALAIYTRVVTRGVDTDDVESFLAAKAETPLLDEAMLAKYSYDAAEEFLKMRRSMNDWPAVQAGQA